MSLTRGWIKSVHLKHIKSNAIYILKKGKNIIVPELIRCKFSLRLHEQTPLSHYLINKTVSIKNSPLGSKLKFSKQSKKWSQINIIIIKTFALLFSQFQNKIAHA